MTNWILSSSVLIVAIILLRRIWRGKISLRCQYALWLLVAMRLIVPIQMGESIFSIENLINEMKEQAQSEVLVTEQCPPDVTYTYFYEDVIEQYEVEQNAYNGILSRIPGISDTGVEAVIWAGYVVWIAGIVTACIVFATTNWKLKKRLNQKVEKLEVTDCTLPVYRSEGIETPCLIGIQQTGIYVTGEVAENPVLLRHVISHELTHYRHGDHIWAIVRCVCLILHWYNPLVWYAAILSKQDAEFACDEGTILKLHAGEWKTYGKTLIQLTCKKKSELLVVTSTMASAKKYINERIALIAKMQGRKQRIWVYAVIAFCVFGLTGVTFTEAKEVYDTHQICIGQYLDDVDWHRVQSDLSEADATVLEKYRTALDGGKVVWVDPTLSGEFSIQEYMDKKMNRMNLEERELILESFLFSDVFQTGEIDVAVLVRHVSKSWVILHEEAGTVYAVEMSHIAFKGIQENGLYYGAGGQGIQYYEKMTLNDEECEKTQMCVRLNGEMVYPQYKNEAEAREKVETGSEVPIYTLVEKR